MGFDTYTAVANGKMGYATEHCKLCESETCREYCGEPKCFETSGSGMGGITWNRDFPLPSKVWQKGPFVARFDAKAFIEPSATVMLGFTDKEPEGTGTDCEQCKECTDVSLGFGIGVGAGGTATVGITAHGTGVSLESQARLDGTLQASYTHKFGALEECGPQVDCLDGKGTLKATASVSGCLPTGWFNIAGLCNYVAEGSVEKGTCKPYKTENKQNFTCSVTATSPADCAKECKKVCRNGKPCGGKCQPASYNCRTNNGGACQGPPEAMN